MSPGRPKRATLLGAAQSLAGVTHLFEVAVCLFYSYHLFRWGMFLFQDHLLPLRTEPFTIGHFSGGALSVVLLGLALYFFVMLFSRFAYGILELIHGLSVVLGRKVALRRVVRWARYDTWSLLYLNPVAFGIGIGSWLVILSRPFRRYVGEVIGSR